MCILVIKVCRNRRRRCWLSYIDTVLLTLDWIRGRRLLILSRTPPAPPSWPLHHLPAAISRHETWRHHSADDKCPVFSSQLRIRRISKTQCLLGNLLPCCLASCVIVTTGHWGDCDNLLSFRDNSWWSVCWACPSLPIWSACDAWRGVQWRAREVRTLVIATPPPVSRSSMLKLTLTSSN